MDAIVLPAALGVVLQYLGVHGQVTRAGMLDLAEWDLHPLTVSAHRPRTAGRHLFGSSRELFVRHAQSIAAARSLQKGPAGYPTWVTSPASDNERRWVIFSRGSIAMTEPSRPPELPARLLTDPEMLDACRVRDFARVFRLIKIYAGIYPSMIARRCDLTPSRVGEVMAGRRQLVHIDVIERVAD